SHWGTYSRNMPKDSRIGNREGREPLATPRGSPPPLGAGDPLMSARRRSVGAAVCAARGALRPGAERQRLVEVAVDQVPADVVVAERVDVVTGCAAGGYPVTDAVAGDVVG